MSALATSSGGPHNLFMRICGVNCVDRICTVACTKEAIFKTKKTDVRRRRRRRRRRNIRCEELETR
jgi:hypothetical protein